MARFLILLLTLALAGAPRFASATSVPDPGPGRTRSTGPSLACRAAARDRGAPSSDGRFFKLYYLGVSEVNGIPTGEVMPEPVILYIPRSYDDPRSVPLSSEGAGKRFSATYPSFKPPKCGDADDDQIDVLFGLESGEKSAHALPSSLRELLTTPHPAWEDVKVQAAPVPPSFEEAFVVEFTLNSSKERVRTKWLSYRDESGLLFYGRCNPNAEIPECELTATVPGTYISMDYRLVEGLLPHRLEVEQGLRALIRQWLADGK